MYHVPRAISLQACLVTLVASLAGCDAPEKVAVTTEAEPRVLEFQTEQEVSFVSVNMRATKAEAEDWWTAQCESRLRPARVRVVQEPTSISYDLSKSIRDLNALAPAYVRGKHTLGLTRTEMKTSIQWEGNYLVDSQSGRACMRPNFTIRLSVSPQTVYIAREFALGSCAYKHIAEHELRHVQANQRQLEQVAKQFDAELQAAFGSRIFYGTQKELRAQLQTAVEQDWFPAIKEHLAKVESVHEDIDSPQEYANNLKVCGGDIARVTGAR